MKHLFRSLALLLVALLTLLPVVSCASSGGKALMTLDHDGVKVSLSVNHYRLLLCRLKGAMIADGTSENGLSASSDAFWDLQDTFDESNTLKTYDAFYREQMLENCKTYLIGLWYFEKNGLKLSETAQNNIQQAMDDLVADFGNGSKTKLNALLKDYGVNMKMLRSVYETEAKLETVQNDLYGESAAKLGTTVKDDYLNAHYLRFRQIYVPYFDYEPVRDANGDTVYFDPENNSKILYDPNGIPHTDQNGKIVTDENGDTVLFVNQTDSKIFYDVDGGIVKYTDKRRELTEAELTAAKAHAKELYEEVKGASDAEFEAKILEENGASEFTDGYYLIRGTDYSGMEELMDGELSALSAISSMLEDLEIGETGLFESANGCNIIRRYQPTSGAYDLDVNEKVFESFADGLMAERFLLDCKDFLPHIVVNEAVLSAAPTIKESNPTNYF